MTEDMLLAAVEAAELGPLLLVCPEDVRDAALAGASLRAALQPVDDPAVAPWPCPENRPA